MKFFLFPVTAIFHNKHSCSAVKYPAPLFLTAVLEQNMRPEIDFFPHERSAVKAVASCVVGCVEACCLSITAKLGK